MSDAHRAAMPIVARPPGAGPTAVSRSGDEPSIGVIPPPGALLPSGGAPIAAPAPAPHRALALDALFVLRTLRDHPRDAGPWGEPAFAREVDRIRVHLAPIRSRRSLAASYARESFHVRDAAVRREPDGIRPARIAYAMRWLELGDGRARAGWPGLPTGRD